MNPHDPKSPGFMPEFGFVPCRDDNCREGDAIHPAHVVTLLSGAKFPRKCPVCLDAVVRRDGVVYCQSCDWARAATRKSIRRCACGRMTRGKSRCPRCLGKAAAQARARMEKQRVEARALGIDTTSTIYTRSRCRRCSAHDHYAKTCRNPGVLREPHL